MSPPKCLLFFISASLTFLHAQAQTVSVSSTAVDVDEDAGSVTITLTHTPPPVALWGATRATVDGTAISGLDYTGLASGFATGGPGVSTIDVVIPILDDTDFDPDETFTLQLTGFSPPRADITVTITIRDDERIPVNLTQIPEMTVRESIGNFTFTISRNDATNHDFNVSLDTMDSTMGMMATAGQDYRPLSGMMVSFAEDEDEVTAYVYIIDDVLAEDSETFCVTIYGPQINENITFYITILDDDTPDNFHCLRGTSQQCLNMGTCYTNGTCDCMSGYQGENCGIETANITSGCGCVNGTCVNDGTANKCICDGGFAGELCDMKAYFHQCEFNGFSVCITPFSVDTFNGLVYAVGKDDVNECNLDLAPIPSDPDDDIVDWCMGYAAFIPFNGSCGELGPNVNAGLTTFTLELRVQYTNGTVRSTDELVTFTCQYNNGSLQVSAGFNTVDPDSSGTNVQRETTDVVPASLEVTAESGADITGPQTIGAIVRICVSVDSVDAFNAIVIDKIVADNSRSGSDFRELTLYDRGCVPALATGIITEGPYWDPNSERHTMCFKVAVFIFSHDIDLANPALSIDIFFTVNGTDISMHVCNSRRKRQAVESEDNRLGTTIYLINPDAVTGPDSLQDVSSTCSCSKWLVPALIGLGVVAITMAVVIVALTVAVFRHYKDKKIP